MQVYSSTGYPTLAETNLATGLQLHGEQRFDHAGNGSGARQCK